MRMQFDDIIDKYRSESYSERDKGTRFEELMARYFMTDPTYASVLEWTVTWSDFFGRKELGGKDTGIDLVAKTKTGEYWAIQCKCYAEDHRVSKGDMDTFISTSGRKFHDEDGEETAFSNRIVVATTDNWGENAIEGTTGQTIPVTIIGLTMLNEAPVVWEEIEEGVHGSKARKEKYRLRPHQQEAVDKAMEHYRTDDRGKMIMACGTGKTFTSLKVMEALLNERTNKEKQGCVLFLAPSIALVGQTLREWMANAEIGITPICVCSDPSVSKKRIENDDATERVEELGAPATTDAGRILFNYQKAPNTVVIFSTYQSIDAVIAAQKAGVPEFDLIVCDEAHRTTGVILSAEDESTFTKVHNNAIIKAKKRLYMTATPRLYGVKGKEDAQKASVVLCSMDDETLYGKEFYNISFGKAVELELLSDYKVLILTTPEKDVPKIVREHWKEDNGEIDVDVRCKIWGCLNALAKNVAYDETLKNTDPDPMRSSVIFCRTIAASKLISKAFNDMAGMPMSPRPLNVKHIDGKMRSMERERLMTWLKKDDNIECHALSNVRCLSEGVDVPALDSVIFMGSKSSLVDVVQSVGRVMRKAEGKKYGYIIIPIVIPESEDPEMALNNNDNYKIVWDVLRALRSHDERLDAEINTFNMRKNNSKGHIHLGHVYGPTNQDTDEDYLPFSTGQYSLDDFGGELMARLVLKVGDREYIENWARNVAKVMPTLIERLTKICQHEEHGYKGYKPAFNRYLKGLRFCVNDNVDEKTAIDMLAQQIVTKPIFERLFAKDGFAMQNSVSQTIDGMLQEIDAKKGLEDINEDLNDFYRSVEMTLSQIDTAEGKQKVITELYEKFFKNAFPKDQSINGVVYTPQEIVDFIIHSAAEALNEEFGIDINDENVNILDPFTGTGTFIARLMETGIITKDNLERKYRSELFANEITLLAYYIATVNIENTFIRMSGKEEYIPFDNILLTDTFNIEHICEQKTEQTSLDERETFKKNKGRIRRENDTPITIIMGNPPYGATQKSANDNAKKRRYRQGIDLEIEKKYLDDSLFSDKKGNVNSVYDNYIRAFRWATDRIGNNDGIIAFVTPNGWLSGSAFEGFRKCIESEFSKICVFNLRGDATSQGEMRRKEGDGVFGDGSRTAISITMLVCKKDCEGKSTIHYIKTADYMKKNEKFDLLTSSHSFASLSKSHSMETLDPKPNGDWIIERNDAFQKLVPLAGDTHKKFENNIEKTIFAGYTRGVATSRDSWAYNYSKEQVVKTKERFIEGYNQQLESGVVDYTDYTVKWTTPVKSAFTKKVKMKLDADTITQSNYRPFVKQWFDCDYSLNEAPYQNPKLFPTSNTDNMLICVAGVGVKKDFSCLMTNKMTDLEIVGKSQCFPLYWYEDSSDVRVKNKQSSLFDEEPQVKRHDGVSDYALNLARSKYGPTVTKEDIFYYVYGYLHSPEYRKTFSDDLKLSLPKIDFVPDKNVFEDFVKAGRDLADLHLNYEDRDPPECVKLSGDMDIHSILVKEDICKVKKIKVYPDEHKVVYNEYITVENIPEEAFQYIVNGRSAIGWLADQYQYSVDKDSGIVNDPNEYAGGSYVLKLLLSIITVSVETVKIVNGLPKLNFNSDLTGEACSEN